MFENKDILNELNESDKKALIASIESNTLSHAYLFTGKDITLLQRTCYEFVCASLKDNAYDRELLHKRITQLTYSDIMEIYPNGATVRLEQLRESIGFLQTAPNESDRNILIIHSSDKMRTQAQNFLLKTIEEPPVGALIILLAQSKDNILGTILSRVNHISLKNNEADLNDSNIRSYISNRMSKLILEGSIEGIFDTSKALMQSQNKSVSQKDAALVNLEYVYSFFASMLIYNTTGKITYYTKEEFGILSGKIGTICNINIINIIENTMNVINKNASVQLALDSMLIDILEECNAENSWNQI